MAKRVFLVVLDSFGIGGAPEFIACVVVAIVHKIKNNLYLSIIVGTLTYMLIIRLI